MNNNSLDTLAVHNLMLYIWLSHAYKKFIETVNYKTEDNVSKDTNSFVVADPSRYVLISTHMQKW